MSKIKVSHKKIPEFQKLHYYFKSEDELVFYIDQLVNLNFLINNIKIKGRISDGTMDFLLVMLQKYGTEKKSLAELRKDMYA